MPPNRPPPPPPPPLRRRIPGAVWFFLACLAIFLVVGTIALGMFLRGWLNGPAESNGQGQGHSTASNRTGAAPPQPLTGSLGEAIRVGQFEVTLGHVLPVGRGPESTTAVKLVVRSAAERGAVLTYPGLRDSGAYLQDAKGNRYRMDHARTRLIDIARPDTKIHPGESLDERPTYERLAEDGGDVTLVIPPRVFGRRVELTAPEEKVWKN
jgi:hypothetical protein